MKILFITGSLQPGKDGVGDYCRLLACELQKRVSYVHIVSLYDKNVETILEEEQCIGEAKIKTTRIPWSSKLASRIEVYCSLQAQYEFSLISFHYVPYAYHSRGLPIWLVSFLKKTKQKTVFQIMLHELWIGFGTQSPLKHQIVGFFQQRILKKIISVLKPKYITTSNYLYQSILQKAGIDSKVINLFSNIPFLFQSESDWERLNKKFESNLFKSANCTIGIFGYIHPEANLLATIADVIKATEDSETDFAVLSFGRQGALGELYWDELKLAFKQDSQVKFERLGLLEAPEVSYILQNINLAISCTPAAFIGKSGVYAAFRSHNVPVVMSNNEVIPGLESASKENLEKAVNLPSGAYRVEYVAKEFLKIINQTN